MAGIDFKGKTVWVTGASSGIGAGLARGFAGEGSAIILSGRKEDALAKVASECVAAGAADTLCLAFEATDYDRLPQMVAEAEAWRGGIDVLFNNAGISQRSMVRDTSMDVFRQIMDVDYFAPIALTKLVLLGMEARGSGLIAVTTSVAGKVGAKLRSGYCSAKHALHGFYDSLRAETYETGVRVALIVPGFVKSDVAFNAITGDGGQNLKREQGHDTAMSGDEAATVIIHKLKKGREEILVGSGTAVLAPYLKRFLPSVLSRVIRNMAPPGDDS